MKATKKLTDLQIIELKSDLKSFNRKGTGRGYASFEKEVRQRYGITPKQLNEILEN